MPEQVTYDEKARLIRVQVWGIDAIEEMMSSKDQVLQLHEAYGAIRLLADVRDMERAASILDLFVFGQDWPHSIRTAILIGDKGTEDMKFLETVAVNRGKQMRIFADEYNALDWLGE